MKRVFLTLAIALPACGKSDRATTTAKDTSAAATLLAHLPGDTDAVVAGSLIELARWPLWRRAIGVIAHEAPGIAERITTTCKLDPWTVLSSAALAFTDDLDSTVMAAETTVDRKRLHECATAVGSDVALEIEDGPLTKYQSSRAVEVAAWTSDRVFLALPQRMDEPEPLKELVPERAVPAALQLLLARVDRTATIWGVALASGDSMLAELIATMPLAQKPVGVHGAIRRTDRLHAQVALVFPDAAAAREATKLFDTLLADPPPVLAPWRDALRVEASNDEARITFELDAARAAKLDELVIAMLPAPTAPPPPKQNPNLPPPPP